MKKIGLMVGILWSVSSLIAVPHEVKVNQLFNHINNVLQRHPGKENTPFLANAHLTLNKIKEHALQENEESIMRYHHLVDLADRQLSDHIPEGRLARRRNALVPLEENDNF
ncbi:hypothetical protein K9K77_00165 [Candidatus Babeliales bacterium]|nr:hypothetical protein [Candidatus Babeliales bacterium]